MAEPLHLPQKPSPELDQPHPRMPSDERRFFVVIGLVGGTATTLFGVALFTPFEDAPDRWFWGTGYLVAALGLYAVTLFLIRSPTDRRQDIGRASSRWWFYLGLFVVLLGFGPIAQWFSGGDSEPPYLMSCILVAGGAALMAVAAGPLHPGFAARLTELVQSDTRRLIAIGLTFAVVIIGLNTYALRQDFNDFVKPRQISERQAALLRNSLSRSAEGYAVTVKVNSLDEEAQRYAGQIYSVLRQTPWNADFSTGDADPKPGNGVTYWVTGEKPQPQGSKPTPRDLLEAAFRSADIPMSGGGGQTAGDYKLYIVVGHRPLITSPRLPLLFRLGSWIAHLVMPGAPV